MSFSDIRRISLISLAAFGLLLGSSALAVWNEPAPTAYPPLDGSGQPPLNTGNGAQTKSGPLTIDDQLTIEQDLSAGGPASISNNFNVASQGGGQLCLNGVGAENCLESFSDIFASYLHLYPLGSPIIQEIGNVRLGDINFGEEGTLDIEAAGSAGLIATAGSPGTINAVSTHGIISLAGGGETIGGNSSAGIFAQAGSSSPNSIGLGGQVYNITATGAYAAYFKGKVDIRGCLRFDGVCNDRWPDTIAPGDYVELLDLDDPAQIGNVALDNNSTAVFTNLVLGSGITGVPIEVTCGDGLCNNNETVLTCESDCFAISNIQAIELTDGTARITWQTNAPATSKVQYGLTEGLGADLIDADFVADHSLQLSSLNHNSIYYYRVASQSMSGTVRFSPVNTFHTLIDTTPPADPTNLHSGNVRPGEAIIWWYHTFQDNPGGSGFGGFIVMRDGQPLGQTNDAYYFDQTVTPGQDYAYAVKAYDVLNNESGLSNTINIHVPTACVNSNDCTVEPYRTCCGEFGCQVSCVGASPAILKGGGSPAILKTPPSDPGQGW